MSKEQTLKAKQRKLRIGRTRKSIQSKNDYPRLAVYRSLKHIYAQLIDDTKNITLCSASDLEIKIAKNTKPVELAKEVGSSLAKKAIEKKIAKVVFDRRAYKYHGRVKAVAEGAREGGLKF